MWRVVAVAALAACVHTNSVQCEQGTANERTCPTGNVCDDVHHLCVEPDQLTSCVGVLDGTECAAGTQVGFCDMAVCLPLRCGDGIATGGEPCDGNDVRGETCLDHGFYTATPLDCSPSCEITTEQCVGTCGDGIVQPEFELCDGNDPSVTCTDFGYGTGALSCQRCGPGFGACKYFGWHKPVFTASTLLDIDATSDTNVWAVGISAQVKHFDGSDWRTFDLSACSIASAATFNGVDVVGDDDVWISGGDGNSHGLVIHIVGTTCTAYVTPNSLVTFTDIAVVGPTDIWLAANGVTHFDGQTFTQADATSASFVVAAGPTDIYSHGNGNTTVRHWDGTSWTTLAIPGNPNVTSLAGTSATDLYVGGSQNGAALVQHWNGASWTPLLQNLISANNVTSIRLLGMRLFIGMNSAGSPLTSVYEYDGAGWTSLNGPNASGRMLVSATPSGHLYAIATSSSQLFRYDGTAVLDQPSPIGVVTRAITLRQDLAFAVVSPGDVYVWNGNSWMKDAVISGVSDIATDGAGSIYTIGATGLRMRTLGTTTWTTLDAAARGYRLAVISASDIWLVDPSLRRDLLHFNGTTTDTVPCATCTSATGVTEVWSSGNNIVVVENGTESMHWNGSTWSTATTVSQLVAVYGFAPNDVVAVQANTGNVYRYDGTSWTLLTSAGLFASSIWGTSDSDIFIGNNQGAVAHYDGARWSPVDVASPTVAVITGAGDSIFFYDAVAASSHRLVRTTPW